MILFSIQAPPGHRACATAIAMFCLNKGIAMKVMVLGAGVTGVTTAWYLAQHGHEVTVIERRGAAAMETSFANGGQISVSHAEPWANPGAPLKVLQWLAREDAPL